MLGSMSKHIAKELTNLGAQSQRRQSNKTASLIIVDRVSLVFCYYGFSEIMVFLRRCNIYLFFCFRQWIW